jgi:HlyD family secretion protein
MNRRLLVVLLLVSSLAVACGSRPSEEATPTPIPTSVVPDKPTYTVERGTVENIEEFSARVSPLREESLYFKKSGYVKVVYVDKGDSVKKGKLLAEIELQDLDSQLTLAQVDLDTAQKRYDAAEEALQRDVYSAQTSLQAAQMRLERAKLQAPTTDFTSLKIQVQEATEALDEARVAYKEALDRPWEPQQGRDALLKNITRAERNLTRAQASYQQALRQAERDAKVYEIDIKLLEMDASRAQQEVEWLAKGVDASLAQGLETARLRVQQLQEEIQTGQLIAPFDGEVTSLSVTPGKAVEAHKIVAVVADPTEVDITADLITQDLSMLEEGQAAKVALSRVPDKAFDATILQLPYPYGTGGGETKTEDEDTRVHLQLANPGEVKLAVGDLVKVSVLLESSGNALWLPPAAIRTFEGRKFVMVKAGDRLQKVDVKVGIEGTDRVEILTGLEEGQIIEGL